MAILKAVTEVQNDIKVIWCDTGYNTPQTYKHAEEIIDTLNLNIHLYTPKQTVAHRNIVLGIPSIEDPKHRIFTEQVKLEPFSRAMKEHQPDVWFTNLRKGQTTFRNSIDIVSKSKDGIVKVSPFYNWSDKELDAYLEEKGVKQSQLIFDVGIGFGKDALQSIRILKNIDAFRVLGLPLYVGHSKKSFLKKINFSNLGDNLDISDKSLIISKYLMLKKVDFLRIHDVKSHFFDS